jgi:glutathione S-transferase
MTQLTLIIGNKNYSSWSLRPWLLMKQFNLEFAEISISLYTPESGELLQKYSPSGQVPVLLHNNIKVWDSLAICEYLAETFTDIPFWTSEKAARALSRSISAEMHSGFQALRQNMPMNCRKKYPGRGLALGVPQDINRITEIWQECRQKYGADGKFLFGDFTIPDAMFAPVVLRFLTYGVQLNDAAQEYAAAILSLPALQNWIAAAHNETAVLSKYEF